MPQKPGQKSKRVKLLPPYLHNHDSRSSTVKFCYLISFPVKENRTEGRGGDGDVFQEFGVMARGL